MSKRNGGQQGTSKQDKKKSNKGSEQPATVSQICKVTTFFAKVAQDGEVILSNDKPEETVAAVVRAINKKDFSIIVVPSINNFSTLKKHVGKGSTITLSSKAAHAAQCQMVTEHSATEKLTITFPAPVVNHIGVKK